MTPITIAGKEYPWPEGCEYFFQDGGSFVFQMYPEMEENEPDYEFCVSVCAKERLSIIAAVAARHFRNQFEKLLGQRDECHALSKRTVEASIIDAAQQEGSWCADRANEYLQAAEAWEELTNGL